MTSYMKIEFEAQNLENVELTMQELQQVLRNSLADVGLDPLQNTEEVIVNLRAPQDLAVIETSVILGLIGLATSLIELYKFLKKNELENKTLELEKAKLLLQNLSDKEKQQLREAFIKEDLPRMLQQAGIRSITQISSSIVNQ